MRRGRHVLAAIVGAVLVLTVGTIVALEGKEVVVLRTVDERGEIHETRTWIAEDEGVLWVEAANPERPFLRHVRQNPQVELRRADASLRCTATTRGNPEGHTRIRRLLAEKYGWADRWIGLLADTSHSIALRLECG